MATNSEDQKSTDEELVEARNQMAHAYRGGHNEDVGDLAQLHDAATTYLALLDTHGPDELPEDLDGETKDQLETVKTLLPKAISGIEQTAAERLTEAENGTPDEGGAQ